MERKILLDTLEKKVEEIGKTFRPSTTFEDGTLLYMDFERWEKEVKLKQQEDWKKIKKLLRRTWGKLKWNEKGWVFNVFRSKYNWNGWSTIDGVALTFALQKQKKET